MCVSIVLIRAKKEMNLRLTLIYTFAQPLSQCEEVKKKAFFSRYKNALFVCVSVTCPRACDVFGKYIDFLILLKYAARRRANLYYKLLFLVCLCVFGTAISINERNSCIGNLYNPILRFSFSLRLMIFISLTLKFYLYVDRHSTV